MMNCVSIIRGQRINLSDLIADVREFELDINLKASKTIIDTACFRLDIQRELSNENYMVFYNQIRTPCGGITLNFFDDNRANYTLLMQKLPPSIHRLVITASIDGSGSMSQLTDSYIKFSVKGKKQHVGILKAPSSRKNAF